MKLGCQKKILPIVLSLILLLNLILIPKIDSFASSGSTPSRPVNENFYYNAFYFVYDQDNSINPPFGYEIQDASLDAFFSAAYNDFVAMSASFGQLLNWSFSQYLDLLWNTLVADYYVTSGQAVEFAGHLWSDNTTVYYYLVEDDGELFKWAFDILGITVTLYLDENGLVYSNGKGQPNGNVKNDDSLLNSLGKAQRDQTSDGKIYRPVKVSLFDGLPAPYFTGTTVNLTWFDHNNTKHLYQITNFQRCILGVQYSYASGSEAYFNVACFYDSGNNSQHDFYLDGVSKQQTNTASWPPFSVNTDIGSRAYNFKSASFDIKSGNLPSYNINIYNPSWSDNYLIAPNKGVFNQSLVAGPVPALWLDYTYYYPVDNPQDVVVPVDTPISLPDLDDWVVENDPEDDPTADEDPVPVSPFEPVPDPGPNPPLPWPVPPVPPIVSGNDDLWPELNITFDLEDGLIDLANPLANFEWPSFSSVISSFLDSIVWVSTIMTALYSGTDFNVLFAVLSVFFIAASLLGLYKWWHK